MSATGSLPTCAGRPRVPEICALTTRIEDAVQLRTAGATRIYLDAIDIEPTPENLERARAAGVIPMLDEVCRELDHARIDPWIAPGMPVAVGNVSELALARELGALPELRSCIPVHNASALDLLAGLGAHGAWLSPELAMDEIRELAASTPVPLGIMAFGRPRLMTCEHCVLQVAYDCDRNHAACPHRRARHWLVNIDGRRLPTRTDARGRSRVYLDEPIDLVPRAMELVAAGVRRLVVDATTLSLAEATQAISRISAALAGESVGMQGTPGLIDGGVA